MKATISFTVAALLFANAAFAAHLPAFIEPRQQPKCSVYSGFKDSPSFTSFCKTHPRPTNTAAAATSPRVPTSATRSASSIPNANSQRTSTSSTRSVPSISTQYFTFEGGQASTAAPVNPVISSAAASNTFGPLNYTITTSGLPSGKQTTTSSKPHSIASGLASCSQATSSSKAESTSYEVNCYVNGSKLPMSECMRTANLTRHHGYTYWHRPTSSVEAVSESTKRATLSSKSNSAGAAVSRSQHASSTKVGTSSARPGSSSNIVSSKATLSAASSAAGHGTTSAPTSLPSAGVSAITNCTRTMNLTRHHGYTYPDTLVTAATTTVTLSKAASGSAQATASTKSSSSLPMLSSKLTSSPDASKSGSTLSTSSIGSPHGSNARATRSRRVGTSRPAYTAAHAWGRPSRSRSASAVPSGSTSTKSQAMRWQKHGPQVITSRS